MPYTSTFLTLGTALSGVEVAQEQLDTTGNNISNINTEDYEEQVVNTTEMYSLITLGGSGNPMQIGTGVDAESITNESDPYLDASYRQQNAIASAASTLEQYSEQINSAIGSTADNTISNELSQFWSDWNNLSSSDPTNQASAEQSVLTDAEDLANSFNSLTTQLTGSSDGSILQQAVDQYNNVLNGPGSPTGGGEVYNDASEIASLNQEIVAESANGGNPNTLIDQRNQYIDDLSSLGSVSVTNNSDGSVDVYFGSSSSTGDTAAALGSSTGTALVSGDTNNFSNWETAFEGAASSADSASDLSTSFGGSIGALIGLTGYPPTSGAYNTATYDAATGGTGTFLEGTLGDTQDQLDTVANDLAQNVNNPDVAGTSTALDPPIFTTTDGSDTFTGSNIQVNPNLVNGSASMDVGTDSSIALAEAAIGSESGVTINGTYYPPAPYSYTDGAGNTVNTKFPGDAYDAFVNYVGNLAQSAQENDTTQSDLLTEVTNDRTSAEGVDLSQEMTNLIQEQQAYQASAKVMTTFGTMMDALMSTVGE